MTPDTVLADRPVLARQAAGPGVKTILLHIQNDKSHDERLATALSLARACEAHLTCLHVTPIEAYVAFDNFGGVFVMNDVIKKLDEEEEALRSRVEDDLRNEDVSWDYIHVTANVAAKITSYAALADVVVTGRHPHTADFSGPTVGLLGDLLQRSRTPLLVPGEGRITMDPTGVAVVAWNGSYEAANAVRASLGLLKLAAEVRILHIDEQGQDAFPSTRLLEYLSRQGIHADLRVEPAPACGPDARFVAGSLIAYALGVNAAYLVVGGYSHSRVGEYLFGGVTRTLLADCPVPLLIAR